MQTRSLILFFWICFAAALIHSFWALSVGWANGILDEHMFRQAQTGLSALFLAKGGPFFSYETPILGAPWSIPFELPIYQWLVAKFHLATGMQLEQSGRAISRLFFLLSLWPLYDILRSLKVGMAGRVSALALYSLSPLYLFWSRTFLIESTALFFALAFFSGALRCLDKPSCSLLAFTGLMGMFAGSIKITTAFTFFLLTGFVYLYRFFLEAKKNELNWKAWALRLISAFVLPGIASIAWVKYSDAVREMNPLADFIASKNLGNWTLGTLEQRLDGDTWYMFFRKTFHDSVGHRTTLILSFLLLPFLKRSHRLLAAAAFASFFIAPMVFTNLHIVHNYYWYANGIFLVAYLAVIIDGLSYAGRPSVRSIGLVFFAVAAILAVRQYHKFFYYTQLTENAAFQDLRAPLASLLKEEEVVLVLGADWFPVVPWGIRQRAMMIRANIPIGSPEFIRSLDYLRQDGKKIGAVLDCAPGKSGTELESLRGHISFSSTKRYAGSCDVY